MSRERVMDDRKALEAAALQREAVADDLLAYLAILMGPATDNPAKDTLERLAVLTAAQWKSARSEPWPIPPEDYVALLRTHAESVERLHCGTKH